MNFLQTAAILAATEFIDEGKLIAQAYLEIMAIYIKMRRCVDSNDLFTSLSTQLNFIYRYVFGNLRCIRFEFQSWAVEKISWVLGSVNLGVLLTKKDSSLTDLLQLRLFPGRLAVDFENVSETKSFEKNFGGIEYRYNKVVVTLVIS